jgi:glycosyltransferase involved in cell wall biosynthesis
LNLSGSLEQQYNLILCHKASLAYAIPLILGDYRDTQTDQKVHDMTTRKYRLAVLQSHPIQYFSPLYRRIAQEPDIDLVVYYCSQQGVTEYSDPGFGTRVQWDVPLLKGYQYKFLPNLRQRDQVAGYWSLVNPAIVTELLQERYSALLVYGHAYATYLLAIGAARLLQVPILMRCETHLRLRRSFLKRVIRRPVMSLLYRMCAGCLAIGTRNAEFYRYHQVNEGKIFHVPYTVDNEFFIGRVANHREQLSSLRSFYGLPANKILIIFASKMTPGKRAMDLLRAYQQVREQVQDGALVFVGSGSEEERLKSYAHNQAIPDVYFLGFRNQSELPQIYAISDLFVLPSENEAWGLIINEVMCAGLPVIATDEIGATPDLVQHGDNGFVYQAGDIETLSRHIRTLITDSALRTRMGQRSLEIISGWSYEQDVQGIRSALEYVAKNC